MNRLKGGKNHKNGCINIYLSRVKTHTPIFYIQISKADRFGLFLLNIQKNIEIILTV